MRVLDKKKERKTIRGYDDVKSEIGKTMKDEMAKYQLKRA